MKKNKVETIKGYGKLTGPAQNGVFTVEVKAADGKASQIKAKKVIISTGSEARMIPGLEPDSKVLTNIEILKHERDSQVADRCGRGRGRRRVRIDFPLV